MKLVQTFNRYAPFSATSVLSRDTREDSGGGLNGLNRLNSLNDF
jgi:hypothetical protein